jgi:DNA mismatch endonuclease, patch repair protein
LWCGILFDRFPAARPDSSASYLVEEKREAYRQSYYFPKQRLAVFVDGRFWHRHRGCKFSYTPKSRPEFWLSKFERNVVRDRLVKRTLRKSGWRVVRIWECQLTPNKQARVLRRLRRALGES